MATRAAENSRAAFGTALALVNPYLGALFGATDFLFGTGGFSPKALSADAGSLAISRLNRELRLPAVTPPPVTTGSGFGAVWDSTRSFYAAQNFPAKAGLPAAPPAAFVAAWNKYSSTSNPGEAEVGWARYAELVANLKAAGYADPGWDAIFANTPSGTKKAGDYVSLALSTAPAVLDFLKPAAGVKPIPTGGPNPGVPQIAFVGAIPEIIVTAPRVAAPAARLIAPWVRAGAAALGFTLAADTVSKGPPTRGRPGRLKPAPAPLPLQNPPLRPLEWPAGLDYTRPPLEYPRMPEITVVAPRVPTATLTRLAPPITEIITRVKRLPQPKPAKLPKPRLPKPEDLARYLPELGSVLSPRITAPRPARLQPARIATQVSAALAPILASTRASFTTPASPRLAAVRLPVPRLPPGFELGRPVSLQTATALQPASKDCRCTCTDTSPKAERQRREERKRRKKRVCFSSSRALSDYIRNRTKGK